ncbi:hypothetical protein BDV38DRAFT_246778 [Aspergillus pseudotamarii]|uniref:Uncharacterized protein n=1 Tax=Aspergillus pseudotamarii TaxID=132259 RepID=A0A5N6SU68_ASPPS|nr:uncharacterized protein BDV38DRAFT_246778 [Aspergillus pseudotamarii]KAE8137447.1 hypothetical protein BDV38DRAFT_246778 [Aspergillus pseudotamarii]
MVRQLRSPTPLVSQQATWLLQLPRRGRHRAGRMLRFRIPLVRPEQHFISWLELHWEPESPESPESPPSQLSQGAAVTAVATARRVMTERNCILVDENFNVEEDERCNCSLRKRTKRTRDLVCLMKK